MLDTAQRLGGSLGFGARDHPGRAVRTTMNDEQTPTESAILGDDEAESIAEALLTDSSLTVADLADSIEEGDDRRSGADLSEVIANSVFGTPEPIAVPAAAATPRVLPATGASIFGARTAVKKSETTPDASLRILRPQTTPIVAAPYAVAPVSRRQNDPARHRKVTLVLCSLFALALTASVSVTAMGLGSAAEAEPDETVTEPTVEGTQQTNDSVAPVESSTTLPPSSVPVPPTTPATTASTSAPTTTAAPTTEAPTTTEATTTTAAPSTTAAPVTTAAPRTTRPPTTRRPTTTQPPATTPAPTQVTIPDITFSQPTWAGEEGDG